MVSVTAMAVEFSERVVDTYNVGSGTPTDVKSIAETLQKLLQQKVETKISGQFRIGDIRHNFADLKKLKDKFSFEPTVKIEKGLAMFVDWVKTEQIQVNHYEESLEELKVKGLFK